MLEEKLASMSGHLYYNRNYLIQELAFAVKDCGLSLGSLVLGNESTGVETVRVDGLGARRIQVVWSTTDHGNLRAVFTLI